MGKIYTKTGDKGTTSLIGGRRVLKSDIRVEAYGGVDELNAFLGLLRDQNIQDKYKNQLIDVQHQLFVLGAFLASDPKNDKKPNGEDRLGISNITEEEVEVLEQWIDETEQNLLPMTHFILPGGHTIVSYCHIARTICRRVERILVKLHDQSALENIWVKYINRLSDFLFVLARMLTKELQVSEVKWIPNKK